MSKYIHVKDEDGTHLFMTKKEHARIKKESYKRFKRHYKAREKGLYSKKYKTSR